MDGVIDELDFADCSVTLVREIIANIFGIDREYVKSIVYSRSIERYLRIYLR